LRWIKPLCTALALLLTACEIPNLLFDNVLDVEDSDVPGITFNPGVAETTVGGTASVKIYVMEVDNLGGVHAQVQFDYTRLTVTSVAAGTFLGGSSVSAPIFIYENDGAGTLDINTFYMGAGNGVSGTGDIATIVFTTNTAGQTYLNFTEQTEMVDADDNPITRMYQTIGLPNETFSNYQIYLTEQDKEIGRAVIDQAPHPRIVLLEGLEGKTTRGWDPGKIPGLEHAIKKTYDVAPIWFGGKYTPDYQGRPLSLRENIASLTFCNVGIGVMSGPIHFAAAVGLPTLTLFGDQLLHRLAPAYFLNPYITNSSQQHRTLLGPTGHQIRLLKGETPSLNLTPREVKRQGFKSWNEPGKQSTKSCQSVITIDEIMLVLTEML